MVFLLCATLAVSLMAIINEPDWKPVISIPMGINKEKKEKNKKNILEMQFPNSIVYSSPFSQQPQPKHIYHQSYHHDSSHWESVSALP